MKRYRFNSWVRKKLWSRKWQPTPVFMPIKFHGQMSLASYSPWYHRVRHNWATAQTHDFSRSHVWMWELQHKEGWVSKNWCFQIVVLEKMLENPLNGKEVNPANPKGNQACIFIGRTVSEAEASILWSPDAKELTHCRRPWCWERLKAKGEGGGRGCDG